MLVPGNNYFNISSSPHSIGLQNNLTIPVPYGDNNWFVNNEKRFLSAGMQGMGMQGLGLGCSSCNKGMGDISNIISSLQSGDLTQLTSDDWILLGLGIFALYFFFKSKGSRSKH